MRQVEQEMANFKTGRNQQNVTLEGRQVEVLHAITGLSVAADPAPSFPFCPHYAYLKALGVVCQITPTPTHTHI